MSALSIKNRIEWGLVDLAISLPLFYLSYYMYVNEGVSAGLACTFTGLLGIVLLRQFLIYPPKKSFQLWLKDTFQPGKLVQHRGRTYIVREEDYGTFRLEMTYDMNGHVHSIGPVNDPEFWEITDSPGKMPKIPYWLTKAMKPLGMA